MRRTGRGEVKKMGDLFEVYRKRLQAPEKTVVSAFVEVVKDVLGVTLPNNSCSYSPHSKTLLIVASGVIKHEILMRKKEILSHLKGRLGEKSAPREIL